jgi:hypothetical protein
MTPSLVAFLKSIFGAVILVILPVASVLLLLATVDVIVREVL